MSLQGLTLDNGAVHLTFLATASETGGALHAQRARYAPSSPWAPRHSHPHQDERFVVEQGALCLRIDGVERIARAGEVVEIGRGVVHQARNALDEPTIVNWETRPALQSAELYRALYAFPAGSRPPLLEALALLDAHREEFRLAFPPLLVQRCLFGLLGPLLRMR